MDAVASWLAAQGVKCGDRHAQLSRMDVDLLGLRVFRHYRRWHKCEVSTKPIDPEPDAFMADIDPTLMKKVFDIPK